MKKAAILIDSSFGIKEKQYPDVYIVPMEIIETTKDKTISYLDQVNIFNKEITEKLRNGSDIKTSQPILGSTIKMLEKLTNEYENVYAFTIPSALSSSFNTWKMLESDYKNLKVYDQTMVGRLAEWTIVDLVHANKNNELNDKFIVDYLNNVRDKRAGILIVPDVTQLKKGGRVSNFKSILIKLLNLKLILTLDKSGLLFRDKANKPDEVIRRSKKILEELIPLDKSHIKRFTVLTNNETDKKFNMNEYLDVLKATYPKVEIEYDQIPTIILAHVGPNYFVFGIDLE